MNNNLNLYHIFYQVAKSKNISGAAKELYISQPAISKAISKLEQNLECTLFIRNSRGVTLTPEGELLFEQVSSAFAALKNGEEKIKMSSKLGMGHISIGVSTTLCKHVLLPYLKKFVKENPHVKVSIQCQSSAETIEALENGHLDIGLVSSASQKSKVDFLPVMDITDAFVTTQTYLDNFKIRESLTNNSLINNATFMMLNKENQTRKYVDIALGAEKISLKNIIEVSNMDLLIDFAGTDIGIACVIKEFVKSELESGELVELNGICKMTPRQIGLAFLPTKHEENPCIKNLIECFNEA